MCYCTKAIFFHSVHVNGAEVPVAYLSHIPSN